MPKKKAKQIGLYVRVSTEEQAQNPEGSIRNQTERLKAEVRRRNESCAFGEIKDIYIDRGLSGKNAKRPALQAMLAEVMSDQISCVIVSELSRISRNTKDFVDIWELFKLKGCAFISLRENFDTSTAAGEMMLLNIANFAQFERKQVSERVVASTLARSKRGLYNGGTVPLGFKLDPNKKGHLVKDEEAAPTVIAAFDAFLKHESLSPAAKHLNANGYKIKRFKQGGGKWQRLDFFTVDNLHHILRNKSYIGLKSYRENGKMCTTKAVWDGFVDPEKFERVQKILSSNRCRKKPDKLQNRYPYLLSGLVSCKICRGVMCGKSAHGRTTKVGYYEHAWSTKKNSTLNAKLLKHDPHRVSAKKLEAVVLEETKKFLLEENYLKDLFKLTKEQQESDVARKRKKNLQADLSSYKSQLDVLTERLGTLPTSVSAEPIYKRMEDLQKKIEATEDLIFQLGTEASLSTDKIVELESFKKFSQATKDVLENGPSELKAKLLRRLIYKVEVDVDSVTLHFYMGQRHYKRELAQASSPFFDATEKNLKKLGLSGSNSLTFGARKRT